MICILTYQPTEGAASPRSDGTGTNIAILLAQSDRISVVGSYMFDIYTPFPARAGHFRAKCEKIYHV
jgi:hypothetical protein